MIVVDYMMICALKGEIFEEVYIRILSKIDREEVGFASYKYYKLLIFIKNFWTSFFYRSEKFQRVLTRR